MKLGLWPGDVDSSGEGLSVLLERVEVVSEDDHVGRIGALAELVAHPSAGELVDVGGVLDEICQHHRALGRFDDAIAANRQAITAGYRSTPDPEADIAEMYVEAGRFAEAATLFETLRERARDDVWLYNSAAWVYAKVDPAESLRWALDGIERALSTGDPDRVIDQLRDMAVDAWMALGVEPDRELLGRVDEFIANWSPPARWPTPQPISSTGPAGGPHDDVLSGIGRAEFRPPMGVSWFPAAEWASARARWPDLGDDLPDDHQSYCRVIEARLKTLQRPARAGSLHVSPVTVGQLDAYALEHGDEAGSPDARAGVAAEVLGSGGAIEWPPRRNDRCWCGSGRKYKQCCGPTPAERSQGAARG